MDQAEKEIKEDSEVRSLGTRWQVTTGPAKRKSEAAACLGKGVSRELLSLKMPMGNAEEASAEMEWALRRRLGVKHLENG